jgi:hypothetical protein
MKNIIQSLVLATAVASLSATFTVHAAEGTAPAKQGVATPTKPKPTTTRMKGKIESVDATARTIAVSNATAGTRIFAVTSATKIMKADQPAMFADAKAGEEVGGSYKTGADGKFELTSLRIGPTTTAAEKAAAKEKAKTKEAAPK